MLMPTIEVRLRHDTGGVLTANHSDERKHAGHSERIWRLKRGKWKVAVACRWYVNRHGRLSSTPTPMTRPRRHVRRGWSTRCMQAWRHLTVIVSTRQLLLLRFHLTRPRALGGTSTIIFTACSTSQGRLASASARHGTDAWLPTVTPRIYLPHPATTGTPSQLLCFDREAERVEL